MKRPLDIGFVERFEVELLTKATAEKVRRADKQRNRRIGTLGVLASALAFAVIAFALWQMAGPSGSITEDERIAAVVRQYVDLSALMASQPLGGPPGNQRQLHTGAEAIRDQYSKTLASVGTAAFAMSETKITRPGGMPSTRIAHSWLEHGAMRVDVRDVTMSDERPGAIGKNEVTVTAAVRVRIELPSGATETTRFQYRILVRKVKDDWLIADVRAIRG